MKYRVFEICNRYNITNARFIEILRDKFNIQVKNNFSFLTEEQNKKVIQYMNKNFQKIEIMKEDKNIKKRLELIDKITENNKKIQILKSNNKKIKKDLENLELKKENEELKKKLNMV